MAPTHGRGARSGPLVTVRHCDCAAASPGRRRRMRACRRIVITVRTCCKGLRPLRPRAGVIYHDTQLAQLCIYLVTIALGQNSVVKKKSPRAAVSALWLTYPIAWDPYQPVGGSESLSSGSGGRNLIVGAVSVR